MKNAHRVVKGGSISTVAIPLAHPSVNQGDAHYMRRCVNREFTRHAYGEDMPRTSGAAFLDPRSDGSAEHGIELAATHLSAREEWLLAQRVAASSGFRKSELLQRFLLEICALALSERAHLITEQHIGVRIFGRPEEYDPGEDNIVRSYARTMRRRLDGYFAGEGSTESLRLDVPRGGYVPVFSAAPQAAERMALETPSPSPAPIHEGTSAMAHGPSPARHPLRWSAMGALTGALVMLLLWAACSAVVARAHRSAAHVLWAQLFERARPTLIVPADSGLGIIENLSHTEATLDGYASGSYFTALRVPDSLDVRGVADASHQHYTSLVDLDICSAIERLPEFAPDHARIRFARNLAVDEMRNSNIILLGSVHSNPWVALFEPRLNFQFVYTPEVDRSLIVNLHPRAGEQAQYRNGAADGRGLTYGVIAFLPVSGSARHVLIVEGLNMAGTQAAARVLFDAAAMQPVLRAASSPRGQLRAFEVLVEAATVDASAPDARIVSTRVAPPS